MIILLSTITALVTYFLERPTAVLAQINLNPCPPQAQPPGGFANLCNLTMANPGQAINTVIVTILVIASIVALFFLIWGGIKWITSGGDKSRVEAARGTIISAVVGLVIAFLAFFILSFVLGFFGISFQNLQIPTIF